MRELLHIAERAANGKVWTSAFREALREFGKLEIIENGGELSNECSSAANREREGSNR